MLFEPIILIKYDIHSIIFDLIYSFRQNSMTIDVIATANTDTFYFGRCNTAVSIDMGALVNYHFIQYLRRPAWTYSYGFWLYGWILAREFFSSLFKTKKNFTITFILSVESINSPFKLVEK